MPNSVGLSLTEFPPFDARVSPPSPDDKHDSPFEFTFEEHFESYNDTKPDMAGAGSPHIKSEANDFFNFAHFSPSQPSGAFDMTGQADYGAVNPSHLGGSAFGQSSFNMGNAGIGDDELADLAGSLDQNSMRNSMPNQAYYAGNGSMPVPMTTGMTDIYSSTPEGAPMQSPFTHPDAFNYGHFRPVQQQSRNMAQSAGFANSVMRAQHLNSMSSKMSESRSPNSPHTPGINGMRMSDDYTSLQQQMMNRMSSSVPATWDGTPSAQSWTDNSPYPSPTNASQVHHAQISEVLRSDQDKARGSVSVKPEPGVGGPGFHSVEAKRRRRRESHNLVERRRRDNINERIQDLANLVPLHRLEDEKVRKHLQTNSPLSPSLNAASMSPAPNASVLGSSAGRQRGAVTQGLPIDDKDKGPNKGDILNSSVSWTRDVMWYLKLKMEQEAQLEDLLNSHGISWPFSKSDDEKRMRSEIQEVVERNVRNNNIMPYTRTNGTGLRVPGHTNIAGDSVNGSDAVDVSPIAGGLGGSTWQDHRDIPVFKEEDEFDDDMMG